MVNNWGGLIEHLRMISRLVALARTWHFRGDPMGIRNRWTWRVGELNGDDLRKINKTWMRFKGTDVRLSGLNKASQFTSAMPSKLRKRRFLTGRGLAYKCRKKKKRRKEIFQIKLWVYVKRTSFSQKWIFFLRFYIYSNNYPYLSLNPQSP